MFWMTWRNLNQIASEFCKTCWTLVAEESELLRLKSDCVHVDVFTRSSRAKRATSYHSLIFFWCLIIRKLFFMSFGQLSRCRPCSFFKDNSRPQKDNSTPCAEKKLCDRGMIRHLGQGMLSVHCLRKKPEPSTQEATWFQVMFHF